MVSIQIFTSKLVLGQTSFKQPSPPIRRIRHYMNSVNRSKLAATSTQSNEAAKGDVIGDVVTPSIFNKPWVRTVAILATLWAASKYVAVPVSYQRLAHFFGYAGWFGSSIWVLFLSPKLMFKSLTRQTFGRLQAKLFPQYFGFSAAMIVLLAATNPFSGFSYTLAGAFCGTALNWLLIEPKVTKSALERYDLENAETRDEERITALRKQSSKFHAMSSLCAMIVFLCATGHGVMLSSFLAN